MIRKVHVATALELHANDGEEAFIRDSKLPFAGRVHDEVYAVLKPINHVQNDADFRVLGDAQGVQEVEETDRNHAHQEEKQQRQNQASGLPHFSLPEGDHFFTPGRKT